VTVHGIDGQESAFKPEDGAITGIKAGSLGFDGSFENGADLSVDLADFCQLQGRRDSLWMNSCSEKNFVGVNIPDPADDFLIHQSRLDGTAGFFQAFSQSIASNGQCIFSLRLTDRGLGRGQISVKPDSAKSAGVAELDFIRCNTDMKNQAGLVGAIGGDEPESAGHAGFDD